MHVSTAYCQCNEDVLEERGYAAPHSPLGIAKMTELLDADILEYLTPKYGTTKSNCFYSIFILPTQLIEPKIVAQIVARTAQHVRVHESVDRGPG